MSRTPAKITQAEIDRVFKAAEKTGLNVRIELPDGTVITTTGKAAENDGDNNEWDQVFDGKDQTKARPGV